MERSLCVMMTSFLFPCRMYDEERFFSLLLLSSSFWNMSGLDVPIELALVPSPPLCGTDGASCSSYMAII